jgi:FKBP-type peptidyl-prolyl cis-trans isomerase
MTATNAPNRPVLLTYLVLAVSLELAVPAMAQETTPDQTEQEKDKGSAERKKSMTKTESGLEYLDVKEGTGELPGNGRTCVVHFTAWLWDHDAKGKGKKFDTSKEQDDSSVDRGVPFTFHLGSGEVIKGWDEGISSMKAGGKRELLIPAALAFGERGAGGVIPPNATLFYEIELLEIWEKSESGLEYFDVKQGTGALPRTGQTCMIHYSGWLWRSNAKAKKFDSTIERDEPFSYSLGSDQVLKGRDEGVATMKVGGKRKLLIPAKLAYGDAGLGRDIPPNSTLFFEIELLKVK